jgi:hypothetical protein
MPPKRQRNTSNEASRVVLFGLHIVGKKCDNWGVEIVSPLQEVEFENE